MNASKIFSFVFGILGTALMLLTVILSLTGLDGEVLLPQVPAEADACTQQMMDALADGDYPAAQVFLYGSTTLGESREAMGENGQLVWKAFSDSFSYAFSGSCYGSGDGICRDVTITTLDIASVSAAVPTRAQSVLERRISDAEEVNNLNLVYDEDGSIRENVMDSVIQTALTQALEEDAKTVTATVTLELVNEDGTWFVLPSAELLKAVSGGL